ncbi:MAG: carboxymuconolactone decarboxylase family protein [Gammaproteobacteria bacterium]
MEHNYIGGKTRENFKEFEELFNGVEAFMGYVPNAHLAMAERPELLTAFSNLAMTVFQSEGIDMQTKQLIALASSLSSGCKYCQAHTSHGAERAGTKEEKIAEILNYSESDYYSDEERAVLDLAFASGRAPNESNAAHFNELKKYFSDDQIIDIVSVISMFGFLNRWNDTLGTKLEDVPKDFVEEKLKPLGWA